MKIFSTKKLFKLSVTTLCIALIFSNHVFAESITAPGFEGHPGPTFSDVTLSTDNGASGAATIEGNLDVAGESNFTNNIYNNTANTALTVNDDLTVTGNINSESISSKTISAADLIIDSITSASGNVLTINASVTVNNKLEVTESLTAKSISSIDIVTTNLSTSELAAINTTTENITTNTGDSLNILTGLDINGDATANSFGNYYIEKSDVFMVGPNSAFETSTRCQEGGQAISCHIESCFQLEDLKINYQGLLAKVIMENLRTIVISVFKEYIQDQKEIAEMEKEAYSSESEEQLKMIVEQINGLEETSIGRYIIFLLGMDEYLVSSCITLGEFNKFQDYIISEMKEIENLVRSIDNLCNDENRDQECDTDEILQFDNDTLPKIKLALKLSEIVFILLEFYGQVLEEYWALSYYETMFAYPINIENGIACHGILKNSSDIFYIGYHINAVCHDPLSPEVSE